MKIEKKSPWAHAFFIIGALICVAYAVYYLVKCYNLIF